jgi:predicted aldo/keto reductase-like oxidoreductase
MNKRSRRVFLGKAFAGALTAGASFAGLKRRSLLASGPDIARRALGKTGEKVSMICLGGFHIGVQKDPAEGIRLIDTAVDRGITFLDNSDDYFDGESERRMGRAIRGKRNKVFLMTKPHPRDKKGALKSLDESLRRLQTDYLDLWQFHEIVNEPDPDWIFSPNGAVEAAYIAKKQGKVRFVGFTGHYDPALHLKMLAKPYEWDTVQMPLNVLDAHYRSFQKQVLPILTERNIGVIAMKTLAFGNVVKSGAASAIEAFHYVLSLPVSTICTGCDSLEILEQAVRAAVGFKPLGETEMAALLARTKPFGISGKYEPFKSTTMFNSPRVAPPPYQA